MMTILLVEDDPDSLEFLSLLLKQWGYAVVPATNAQDALDLTRLGCPDVIISDLMMPKMDGNELLVEIRKLESTCTTFFIMLTGFPTVSRVVDAVTRGADEVLVKPLDVGKLAEILNRVRKEKGL